MRLCPVKGNPRVYRCWRGGFTRAARLKQAGQLFGTQMNDLARPESLIHQPAHGAQLVHLFARVHPIPLGIAGRLGKAITALPHAQQILGDAGFPLDHADGQAIKLG